MWRHTTWIEPNNSLFLAWAMLHSILYGVVWYWQILEIYIFGFGRWELVHGCYFHAGLWHVKLTTLFLLLNIVVFWIPIFWLLYRFIYLVFLVIGVLVTYLELIECHVVLLFVVGFIWRVSWWVHGSHDVLHLDAVGSSLCLIIISWLTYIQISLMNLCWLNTHNRLRLLFRKPSLGIWNQMVVIVEFGSGGKTISQTFWGRNLKDLFTFCNLEGFSLVAVRLW